MAVTQCWTHNGTMAQWTKTEWQQYVSKSDTESKGYIPESKRERESKALEEYLEL